jgi:hypothetical protein
MRKREEGMSGLREGEKRETKRQKERGTRETQCGRRLKEKESETERYEERSFEFNLNMRILSLQWYISVPFCLHMID